MPRSRASRQQIDSLILWLCHHCLLWYERNTLTFSWVCHNKRMLLGTRVSGALAKVGLLLHPSFAPRREGDRQAVSLIRKGQLLGCLAAGFGAFELHCFVSHHWVGRAKTKSVLWLVTSRFGLQCGESSWLPYAFSNAEPSETAVVAARHS